jgi:diguanylate cyclase (GGDEF)-like protein
MYMAADRRPPRARLSVVLAVVVVLGGLISAFVGASFVAGNNREEAANEQATVATAVVEALDRALAREADFVVNATAHVALHPDITTAELEAWTTAVGAYERYPEVVGVTFSEVVEPNELAAYAARVTAGRPDAAELAKKFTIAPGQPFACFNTAVVGNGLPVTDLATDYCASEGGRAIMAMPRDFGRTTFVPYEWQGELHVAAATAVFRDGLVPATQAEREANFLGVVGTAVKPNVVVDAALRGHDDVAVVLRYRDQGTKATFAGGHVRGATSDRTVELIDGWTLDVAQPALSANVLRDGNARSVLIGVAALAVLLGALVYVLGTGRARALRLVAKTTGELRHQALHDPLTGLANRALLLDRLEQLLARSRRSNVDPSALFLDLDGFKTVNDTLGHEAGDRLLQAVAGRLTSAVRDADTIARMGGDEFVVLIDGGDLHVAPELVAERVLDVLRQPFELDGVDVPVRISASVGIASGLPAHAEDLVRDADVALYEAKGSGKNVYAVFEPEMERAQRHGIELEFDLRGAVDRGEFELLYQPIYDLDDLTLIGVEALLRWRHPKLGVVMPDEFIPILERTGAIVEVGRWVLAEACEQMASWHRLGSQLTVSVNVSARQFDNDGIVDDVTNALRVSGLDPMALTIEVTETAVMRNVNASVQRLEAIKVLGVRIAIDDFGTGYSSLASLQLLPVDSLKIDRSFISAIAQAPESRALVRTIVQLGRDLGLTTLAEGVETTEQVDLLRGDDVTNAQGFLLARPLDAATIERTILFAETPLPYQHG